MPDPAVYTPSGELQNLLADRATKAAEERAARVTVPAPPDPNRTELEDGRKIVDYDNTPAPVIRFTRSQLAENSKKPGWYASHRHEILEAQANGLIVDDISKVPKKTDRQLSQIERLYLLRSSLRAAESKAAELNRVVTAAERLVEAEKYSDEYDRNAAAQRLNDAQKAAREANALAGAAKKKYNSFAIEGRKVQPSNH